MREAALAIIILLTAAQLNSQTIAENQKDVLSHNEWSVDLFFYPQFRFKNSVLTQIYLIQTNLNPTLHLHLWRGATLTAQAILPLYNQYSKDESRIRPGFLTLSQQLTLPLKIEMESTIGNFNRERAGVDLKLFKAIGKSFGLYGQLGATFWSQPFFNQWYFSEEIETNWRVGANYFLKKEKTLFNLNLSKFLENDIAVRGEVTRYFKSASVGFYIQTLQYDGFLLNGGFFFTVALPPRNKGNRRFRVSTADNFALEYIARPYSRRGLFYNSSPDENSNFNFFNRQLLKTNY